MRSTIGLLILAAAPGFAVNVERSFPIFFFPNSGQTDPSIRYLAQSSDLQAAFLPDSAVFQGGGARTEVHFRGANPAVEISGADPMPGQVNFLIGDNPDAWKTGIATYRKIVYRDLYPGIDMNYVGSGRRMKSEFIVAPGADPSRIQLRYADTALLTVDARGDLIVRGGGAELRDEAPEIYQDLPGRGRVAVEGRYRLLDAHTVAFELGAYDAAQILVIDPVVSYATYLGGSGISAVTGVAVDISGNLYVSGWTEALNFPIAGAVQASNMGGVDAFVAKLSSTGTTLMYATYIGGRGDDRAYGIAVNSGIAYVTGYTASSNFPVAVPIRSGLGTASRNAFALKLNPTGNSLLFCTYLGGSTYDTGMAIAVDSVGNAYIAGDAMSTDFPTLNPSQSTLAGQVDVFVTKLTTAGVISFSTFLGGSSNDHAGGIAVDTSNNIYVAGGTFSTNFPVLAATQSAIGGGQDAFLTKFSSTGALLFSTYLGGSAGTAGTPEQANGIAVDSTGNAYVTGVTSSPNFPVTVGAFQTLARGGQDTFVVKFNTSAKSVVYGTFIGGTSFDWASGIAVDSGGSAYIAGYTSSANFPIVSPVQTSFGGMYDAFVSKLNPSGNGLMFSTFYGGTGSETATSIALDSGGNIFTGGQTASLNLPLVVPLYATNTGGTTGWIMRLGVTAPPPQLPSAISVTPTSGSGNTVTFTAQYSHPAGASAIVSASLLVNASASVDYACYVSYSPATGQFTLANDVASSGSTVVFPAGGSGQNSECTLIGSASSATIAGTNLTLVISLLMQPAFSGSKNVYLAATDASSSTGWMSRGTWSVTIPPPLPTASSVSPNSSSGSSQTFTFVYTDTQNATNIAATAVLFAPSVVFTNGCYIVYDASHATIQLAWDNGLGSASKPIASTATLQNTQCSVGATSSAVSGLSLVLTIAVSFKGPFSGNKNIYMYAAEGSGGLNTGWVQNGVYTVAAGGTPVVNSVVPSGGTGPSQRFTFTMSDVGGSGFITGSTVVIGNSTSNLSNSCVVSYDRLQNRLALSYDNPANGSASLSPGSASVVANSQCTLNGVNSTVFFGQTSVVVTLDLSFVSTYAGSRSIYVLAGESSANSGYVSVGLWNVTGGAPTADSISPASGSGSSATFNLTVSDSANSGNISGVAALFTNGPPSNTANACYAVYDRIAGNIILYADDGVTQMSKPVGSSATLQNSRCAVGFTGKTVSGNSLTFSLQLVFLSPAFSGAKTVYLQANEPSTNSGFVARGTWTVP